MPGKKSLSHGDEEKLTRVLRKQFCLRDQALIAIALNTGLRITEILSLNVGQVWGEGGVRSQITLSRAHANNGVDGAKPSLTTRTVPLNSAVAEILRIYLSERNSSGLADPDAPLFPSQRKGMRLSRWRANVILHTVLQAAGIADHGAYSTRSLRKTFARKVYKQSGHDINLVRASLGNRRLGRIHAYLEVDPADVDAAIRRLGRS